MLVSQAIGLAVLAVVVLAASGHGAAGGGAAAAGGVRRPRRDRRPGGVLPRARDRHDEHRRADRRDRRVRPGGRRDRGGERPAALQLAGIVAAIVGVVLASREQIQTPASAGARAARGRASRWRSWRRSGSAASRSGSARAPGPTCCGRWSPRARPASRCSALVIPRFGAPIGASAERGLVPLTVMGMLDLTANGLYAIATRHGLLSARRRGGVAVPAGDRDARAGPARRARAARSRSSASRRRSPGSR